MKYFFIYYMNLMFSALSVEEQKIVIDRCLAPLLRLADKGHRFGLQISGVSLEIIQDYRPELIDEIKKQISDNKIEFIGNGYGQIIQPLFPHRLNLMNQLIGQKIYADILNCKPNICTINEMVYSSGSCESILEAGYNTILMEWNNPRSIFGKDFPNQFITAKTTIGDNVVDVLWCDTVAFQKFQKYVHGEWNLDEYTDWLDSYTTGFQGALCLYCSDAEIFGFRPQRYGTEITSKLDEWARIEALMDQLGANTILPSEIPKQSDNIINITNVEHPIVVKKQTKYNVNRWALSGRSDQKLNSLCYRILEYAIRVGEGFDEEDWKKLIRLASSDLRTHIQDGRWTNALGLVDYFEAKLGSQSSNEYTPRDSNHVGTSPIILDESRGQNIVAWPAENPAVGRIQSGDYTNVKLMNDNYSGFTVIEKLGQRKVSDLDFGASKTMENWKNSFKNSFGYEISKEIVSASDRELTISTVVTVPNRTKEQIKIANFTLVSEYWDIETLYYCVNLGGKTREKFPIGNKGFDQDAILNLNVIGVNGFAPTENKFIVGDQFRNLEFKTDPSACFSLIRLCFDLDDRDNFLLRVIFIVQDVDETFRESTESQTFTFSHSLTLRETSL